MILGLYAVYDKVSGVYDGPHVGKTDAQMIRAFGDQVNTEGSPINLHREDFILYKVGTWNDATADLIAMDPAPQKLAVGTDFADVTQLKEVK